MSNIMDTVRLFWDRSNRELAGILYRDETERGQRKVRAIRSKLRRIYPGLSIISSGSMASEDSGGSNGGKEGRIQHPASVKVSSAQAGCGGDPLRSAQLAEKPESDSEYILERDVITVIIQDETAASVLKRLSSRVSGSGFYIHEEKGVTFQVKADTILASEPNGDPERAAQVLVSILQDAGIPLDKTEAIALKVERPALIGLDELTVVVNERAKIKDILRVLSHFDGTRARTHHIAMPSPLIPELKAYCRGKHLRIELVAHNGNQAHSALLMRAELIEKVLSRTGPSGDEFRRWLLQYWRPLVNSHQSSDQVGLYDLPVGVRECIVELSEQRVLWFGEYVCGLTDRFKRFFKRDGLGVIRIAEEQMDAPISSPALRVLRGVIMGGGLNCPYHRLIESLDIQEEGEA